MKANIQELSFEDTAKSTVNSHGVKGHVKNAEGFVPLRLFLTMD
jgi:hypothetical protein